MLQLNGLLRAVVELELTKTRFSNRRLNIVSDVYLAAMINVVHKHKSLPSVAGCAPATLLTLYAPQFQGIRARV